MKPLAKILAPLALAATILPPVLFLFKVLPEGPVLLSEKPEVAGLRVKGVQGGLLTVRLAPVKGQLVALLGAVQPNPVILATPWLLPVNVLPATEAIPELLLL